MIELVANGAITLVGVLICYTLGYRKSVNQMNLNLPREDCICGHRANTHKKAKNGGWAGCGNKGLKNGVFNECPCTQYIPVLFDNSQ